MTFARNATTLSETQVFLGVQKHAEITTKYRNAVSQQWELLSREKGLKCCILSQKHILFSLFSYDDGAS